MKRRLFVLAALIAVSVAAASTYAWALAGDTGPIIHACLKQDGNVRIIDAAARCKPEETAIQWNQQGPQGLTGAQGLKGDAGSPGAKGDTGSPGAKGDTGSPGPKGDPGSQGPAGQTGAKGDTGSPGPAGTSGAPNSNLVAYMTASGMQGDVTAEGENGAIELDSFNYEVQSPRDVATGHATGRRIHKPIAIVKRIDATSPLWFQALVNNQVISSVKIDFCKVSGGSLDCSYSVTLTNVEVSDRNEFDTGNGLGHFERLELVFDHVTVTAQDPATGSPVIAEDDFGPVPTA